MAVSRVCSVDRSRPGWLAIGLPAGVAWLSNDVRAGRGLAVARPERRERQLVLKLGMPATVFTGSQEEGDSMAAVMIGADPHTAVAISVAGEPLGQLRVRASAAQAQRLLAWVAACPERAWAVEGAGGLGHLLAQHLLAAG
jgi:hypothetical protein